MLSGIQSFVRGCFVDPSLERKAHQSLDEFRQSVSEARQATRKISDKVDSLSTGQVVAIGVVALIGAGILIGATQQEARRKQ